MKECENSGSEKRYQENCKESPARRKEVTKEVYKEPLTNIGGRKARRDIAMQHCNDYGEEVTEKRLQAVNKNKTLLGTYSNETMVTN